MLSLQVFADSSRSKLLADFSSRAQGVRFSTNAHGFAVLSVGRVDMSPVEAFEVYDWTGTPHVAVTDNTGATVWEGRLEDIGMVAGGVSLTAFGYARALGDLPYTALWSQTGSAGWDEVTEQQRANARPAAFEMDNNNRLYIAPKKGEVYAASNGNLGELSYAVPYNGLRDIVHFSADCNLLLPTGWIVRLLSCDYDLSNVTVETTVTATGSAQSGSWSVTLTARQRLIFSISNNSGSPSTITDETGVNFARLTNIRVRTTANDVLASTIATSIANYVSGTNPGQLRSSAALIEPTTVDMRDEFYEDDYPADILDRLALLHGYEWGVGERRLLYFRPRGSAGRHWYVDVIGGPELQRSLDDVRNSAYGVYRSASGETLRTSAATDIESVTRYGLTRRGFVNVQTTSSSEAQTFRDTWLADRTDRQARARIEFAQLYDEFGGLYPLYSMRAGDRVTMRNLSPVLSGNIDRIRTFVIGETAYDPERNVMDIAPDEPTPTLVTLVARRGAGF